MVHSAPPDSGAPRAGASTPVIDLRPMMRPQRHATVFAAIDALAPGRSFVLINDHAPVPLTNRIEMLHPGEFSFQYLEEGPVDWQLVISRNPA